MELYEIRSHGTPIGTTDLAFARVDGLNRAGWLQVNEEGERVMAIVGAVLPLMRASARHEVRDERPAIVLTLEVEGPTLPPELVEAMERVQALELTLHRADGSVVPTENIGLQDVEQLRSLFVEDDSYVSADSAWDEGLDDETRAAIEHDVAALLEDADFDEPEPWMTDDTPTEDDSARTERYQAIVRLVSEWDVP